MYGGEILYWFVNHTVKNIENPDRHHLGWNFIAHRLANASGVSVGRDWIDISDSSIGRLATDMNMNWTRNNL
jgi:hypothetical protein